MLGIEGIEPPRTGHRTLSPTAPYPLGIPTLCETRF